MGSGGKGKLGADGSQAAGHSFFHDLIVETNPIYGGHVHGMKARATPDLLLRPAPLVSDRSRLNRSPGTIATMWFGLGSARSQAKRSPGAFPRSLLTPTDS